MLSLRGRELWLREASSDLKSSDLTVDMPKKFETATEVPTEPTIKKARKYTGPAKGSEEAKERMAKVRAAQYAKNNLVYAHNA